MKSAITTRRFRKSNQDGFALVISMLIMLVLTIIGIAANRDTSTELLIAGNDRTHKQTFFEADGATELAAEVLEQNIACLDFVANGEGSVTLPVATNVPANSIALDGIVGISGNALQLWQNGIGTWTSITNPYPKDNARDMWFPVHYAADSPHTNMTVEGTTELNVGGSVVFGAGYLGLGRSIAGGGAKLQYEIFSQRIGPNNSESIIRVEWRHIVGMEDPHCRYN